MYDQRYEEVGVIDGGSYSSKRQRLKRYLQNEIPEIGIVDFQHGKESHLDYCDIIYHIPSISHQPPLGRTLCSLMQKVERIQYQAALAIIGTWQGSSRSKIYDELGWETLSDPRKYRRVLQIHKILNNNSLSYLKEKLPPYCREMFSGNIRNTFHTIRCKSYRYMNSFFPDAIASWNLFMDIFNYKVFRFTQKRHYISNTS